MNIINAGMRLDVEISSREAIAGFQRQAKQIETECCLLVVRGGTAEIRPVMFVFDDAIAIEAAPAVFAISTGSGRVGGDLRRRVGEILLMLAYAGKGTEEDPAPAGIDFAVEPCFELGNRLLIGRIGAYALSRAEHIEPGSGLLGRVARIGDRFDAWLAISGVPARPAQAIMQK